MTRQIISLPFRSLKASVTVPTGPDDAAEDGVAGHTAGNTFNQDSENPNTGTFYLMRPGEKGGGAIQIFLNPEAAAPFIAFNDVNCFDNTCMGNASNVTFMTNILNYATRESATTVCWDTGRGCKWDTAPANTSTLRGLIIDLGFTLTIIASSSGSLVDIPSNVRVLFLWMPVVAYTAEELDVLRTFSQTGGVIVFIGEHGSYYSGFAVENAFFAGMGSSMTVTPATIDCGYVLLPKSSVMPHALTSGMTNYYMACTSVLNGGTALIRSSEGTGAEIIVAVNET